MRVEHLIKAPHFTNFTFKITATHIFKQLAGAKYGLLAYHSFTLHLPLLTPAIGNIPFAPKQLYSKGVVVYQGYAVGKHILLL